MDRLPPETQEQLKKMSTTRIVLKLGQAGYDEDRLVGLERADLLEAWAETLIAKSEAEQADPTQKVQEASTVPSTAGDLSSIASEGGSAALRLRELEFEERKAEREDRRARLELEVAREKAAQELEEKKLEAARERELRIQEAEERRAEREAKAEQEKAERDARMRLEQAKLDHEIRVLELRARQSQLGEDERDDGETPSEPSVMGILARQTKRFGDTMRHVLPKCRKKVLNFPNSSKP